MVDNVYKLVYVLGSVRVSMSRPSAKQKAEIERLEYMAVLLASVVLAAEVLEVRLEQLDRWASAPRELLEPARLEVRRIVDDCSRMQALLKAMLGERQRERVEKNRKRR